MYIWKVEPLIEDLKNNNLPQNEQIKYLLALAIISIFATDPLLYAGSTYSVNDSIGTALILLISIWGMWLSNRANTDSKDILLRFCTLCLPIGVRFLAWFIPACVLFGAIEGYFGLGQITQQAGNTTYQSTIYSQIFMVFAFGVYYWRISVAISKVCAKNA